MSARKTTFPRKTPALTIPAQNGDALENLRVLLNYTQSIQNRDVGIMPRDAFLLIGT